MKRLLDWLEVKLGGKVDTTKPPHDFLSKMPVEDYQQMMERVFNYGQIHRTPYERNSNGEPNSQRGSSDRAK